MKTPVVLETRSLSKHFPGVQALDQVNFSVNRGEVHGLIGANGAGKSTLVKILAGVESPDAGEILIDGVSVDIHDAKHARQLGLAFIHQELNLVGRMTVAENLILGAIPHRFGFVSRRKLSSRAAKALSLFSDRLDPETPVAELSVVEQWLVSVARVSLQEAQVIFLDEPTAALGAHEEAVLFSLIRSVVDRGVSVVFISHRLTEVLELSDRVTALRGGRHVGTYKNDSLDHQTLVELVAGRAMSDAVISSTAGPMGEPALELQLLSAGPVRDVTFTLYQGEVLGVGGLVGSGRTELLEAIFGCRQIESGEIRVFGNSEKFRHPSDAVRSGVALLPEDRREQALFSQRSVRFNTVIVHVASFARGLLRLPNSRIEEEIARRQLEDLSIRAIGPQQLLAELSGGNQQKVVFGRWLCGDVMIFLADEPTKGVDVAGKLEILGELKKLASTGAGVIFVSSQFEEVADVADRVLIMREGRVVEILETPTSENEIMQACIGGKAA